MNTPTKTSKGARGRRAKCPLDCGCICHDTGGVTAQHGDNGRCPTKDGKPLDRLIPFPDPKD